AHELQAHHDHARDPKENNVEAGDEYVRRIERFQFTRWFGPAERGERPERRGEPGVEDVWVAAKLQRFTETFGDSGHRRFHFIEVLSDRDINIQSSLAVMLLGLRYR